MVVGIARPKSGVFVAQCVYRRPAGVQHPDELAESVCVLDPDGILDGSINLAARRISERSSPTRSRCQQSQPLLLETRLEGRLPVVTQNSAFVGQANIELNRRAGGSEPIPFYLLQHIGGSSTLRGFALDRFMARTRCCSRSITLPRHPNIQVTSSTRRKVLRPRIRSLVAELAPQLWHRLPLSHLSRDVPASRIRPQQRRFSDTRNIR